MQRRHVCSHVLATAIILYHHSIPAAAEDAPDRSGSLEVVVVTAQKRSQLLSDVPLSITAATGEQLVKQGISSPVDLGRLVPGFSYQKTLSGTPVFAIRGIGVFDTNVGMSPTVTVYVDQVPLPYLAMTQAAGLDLERIEVLKGPQGTLFGQNSTGGAINYIAAKPTQDLQVGGTLTYGRFNQLDSEAFISGPLTQTLSARVAVRRESRDPWQKSESRPGDELGRRDFTAARLLLDWQPSDALKLEFNVNGWRNDSDTQVPQFTGFTPGGAPGNAAPALALSQRPPAPRNARIADWDADIRFESDDDLYQVGLRGDLDLPANLTLTSITAYSRLRQDSTHDSDGTDFNDLRNHFINYVSSFSQELRLAGNLGTRTTFTLGGNYQRDLVDLYDGIHYNASNNGVGPFRYNDFALPGYQNIHTKAGFAALDFNITDTLTAQAGARYTRQTRDFRGCLLDGGDGRLAASVDFLRLMATGRSAPAAPGSCVTVDEAFNTVAIVNDSLNQNNVAWRAGLNWKPAQDTLLYVNVTQGYKAGAFDPLPAVFASQLTPVTQESVLAYELGFKMSLFERAVQLSGAGFYYDYQDKQILGFKQFPIFGHLPSLQNIPKSSVRGAELQATMLPLEGLRLTTGVSYIDSRVDGHIIAPDPFGTSIDLKGQAFPNAPKWQLLGDAEYLFPVSSHLSVFFGGAVTYRSATNAAFGERAEVAIPAYTLLDVRAGIQSNDDVWRVQLWGHNALNRYYLLSAEHQIDALTHTVGMPATYGITISGRF